jgi:hypothetical protein
MIRSRPVALLTGHRVRRRIRRQRQGHAGHDHRVAIIGGLGDRDQGGLATPSALAAAATSTTNPTGMVGPRMRWTHALSDTRACEVAR